MAQVLHASHVLNGLSHSWPKVNFVCHSYVRFRTKVISVDSVKHLLEQRLGNHHLGTLIDYAILY